MKALPVVLAGLCVLGAPIESIAQTAQARMHCWSARFQHATFSGSYAYTWRVDLTTIQSGLNGELMPSFQGPETHESVVRFYDNLYEVVLWADLWLDVPMFADVNTNGIPDFFEVSQEIDGLVTSGYLLYFGDTFPDDVQATWFRPAGSPYGTCVLSIPDPMLPLTMHNIYHSFTVLEYQGSLAYTPGITNVSGTLSVTNSDFFDVLEGPLLFEKSPDDPANELLLVDAALTNAYLQPFSLFDATTFLRDLTRPTNYSGLVEFVDGNPNTWEEDYYLWQLYLDDPNDTNGNGIPDFSDAPAMALPRQPLLSLTQSAGNLLLTLRGDVGWTNRIQAVTNLASPNWQTVLTVKQTNDPQTLTLPLPSNPTFWRSQIAVP